MKNYFCENIIDHSANYTIDTGFELILIKGKSIINKEYFRNHIIQLNDINEHAIVTLETIYLNIKTAIKLYLTIFT